MLRRAGVVGDPAGHSLSPAIHRAGYVVHGLGWRYDAHTVPAESLSAFVRECAGDPSYAGLSVTAPHKQAIAVFGEPDEPTRLLGAGNTILFGERPTIHNTDVPGFARAWRTYELPAPRSAAVIGNGATARSILLALAGIGLRDLVVLARRPERGAALANLAAILNVSAELRRITDACPAVDVVVNTVPPEATATVADSLASASQAVFDVVYDPWPTPLGRAGQAAGRPTLDGLDLLAGQAVDQFFLMTGKRVTFAQCRAAAHEELKSRL